MAHFPGGLIMAVVSIRAHDAAERFSRAGSQKGSELEPGASEVFSTDWRLTPSCGAEVAARRREEVCRSMRAGSCDSGSVLPEESTTSARTPRDHLLCHARCPLRHRHAAARPAHHRT